MYKHICFVFKSDLYFVAMFLVLNKVLYMYTDRSDRTGFIYPAMKRQ